MMLREGGHSNRSKGEAQKMAAPIATPREGEAAAPTGGGFSPFRGVFGGVGLGQGFPSAPRAFFFRSWASRWAATHDVYLLSSLAADPLKPAETSLELREAATVSVTVALTTQPAAPAPGAAFSLSVVFPGSVTREGCFRFTCELLKHVLYQRQQLPLPYEQLSCFYRMQQLSKPASQVRHGGSGNDGCCSLE